jgi:hypothetical protein
MTDQSDAALAYVAATRAVIGPPPEDEAEASADFGGLINAAVQGVMSHPDFAKLDARVVMFALGTAAGAGFNSVPQQHWGLLSQALESGLKNGIAVYCMATEGNA